MAMLEYTPPTDPWVDIVFEDDDILAVNKPSGLLSVPGRLAEHYDSMWSRLKELHPEIQVVHRLDMSTSGLMLLAKNKPAERALKSSSNIASLTRCITHVFGGMLSRKKGILIFH